MVDENFLQKRQQGLDQWIQQIPKLFDDDSDNEQAGDGKADSANVEFDDSTGDTSPYFKRRIDRGEDELRRASEREKSKTCADELAITKSLEKVERRKKEASKPKPTAEEQSLTCDGFFFAGVFSQFVSWQYNASPMLIFFELVKEIRVCFMI